MSSTTFVDQSTPIVAAWLNDVNRVTYTGFSGYTAAPATVTYGDTGVLGSFATSVAGYNQFILQNTSSATNASANFNISNNAATAGANYGEMGINSSTFVGTGSFSQAGAVYLAAASTDLVIGTYGSNSIKFVTNSSVTDAFSIIAAGVPKFPSLTSVQKNAIANAAGLVVFDSTIGQFSGNTGSAWGTIGGGATGGGADQIFNLNSTIMTTTYAIPSGKNASMVGPLTVNSGVTLTIPTGSRMVVL